MVIIPTKFSSSYKSLYSYNFRWHLDDLKTIRKFVSKWSLYPPSFKFIRKFILMTSDDPWMTSDDSWMTSDDLESTVRKFGLKWSYDLRWPLNDLKWPWKYHQKLAYFLWLYPPSFMTIQHLILNRTPKSAKKICKVVVNLICVRHFWWQLFCSLGTVWAHPLTKYHNHPTYYSQENVSRQKT